MLFDKSRVYTILNADELKVGSRVIVADSLCTLKARVEYLKTKEDEEDVITTIIEIRDEYYERRFVDKGHDYWNLAYLVAEPEEKKLKWTDLKIGDVIQNKNHTRSMMVIGIDHKEGGMSHIFTGAEWFTNKDLECWEKVE